jgi:hypothetical protein
LGICKILMNVSVGDVVMPPKERERKE